MDRKPTESNQKFDSLALLDDPYVFIYGKSEKDGWAMKYPIILKNVNGAPESLYITRTSLTFTALEVCGESNSRELVIKGSISDEQFIHITLKPALGNWAYFGTIKRRVSGESCEYPVVVLSKESPEQPSENFVLAWKLATVIYSGAVKRRWDYIKDVKGLKATWMQFLVQVVESATKSIAIYGMDLVHQVADKKFGYWRDELALKGLTYVENVKLTSAIILRKSTKESSCE
jgi:hypothetical protein